MLVRMLSTIAIALGLTAAAGALAQVPAGPALRLIVPFTPGTGIDLVARTVGPKLGERLGRPVLVDNRAGASGNIGTEAVVRAAPNGQTLLVSVNTLVMNRSLYPKLPFDPIKDLVPVSLTSWGQLLLVTNPATGFRTAGDLIQSARAHPGRINYASPGVGTCGSSGWRLSLPIASATSFPAFRCGSATWIGRNMVSTWPPSKSVSAPAVPRYGLWVRKVPVVALNSSMDR